MLRSNQIEDSVEAVVAAGIREVEEDLLAVNPSRETIRALVETARDVESPPAVRLLAAEGPVKGVMDDFLVASVAADLVEEGSLAIRTVEAVPRNSLFVSEASVGALVTAGPRVAALTTTAGEFVSTAGDYYDDLWADADDYGLRTPAISTVRTSLGADIGEEAAADFDAILESLDSARGNGEGLDEVTISLLVAARNDELLYDISKWGEDVGLASKATFSRTKTRLEDTGLLDTEKVPIDVGRPRLRLKLGDDRLADADIDELPSVAHRLLAA
ncbi:MAG: DUF5821 family protein [Haloarculaceae archaeon]